MQPDTHNHYGSVSRFLHWGMALCFALMFLMALAWRMDARWQSLIPAHEALGNLLLMLLFFRFIWVIASENRPAADSRAARLGHLALYLLMLIVPSIALLRDAARGRDGSAENAVTRFGDLWHGRTAWLLLALIAGHIAMTIIHQRRGEKVLQRMAGRREQPTPNPGMPMTSNTYDGVVFDCDATLSALEGIDQLAALAGVADQVSALTHRAMNGEVPLEAVYGERLALIRPRQSDLAAIAQQYLDHITPGARETIAALQARGVKVAIVSGGILDAILPLAAALGVAPADTFAVRLQFTANGDYAGFDASPLATAAGKAAIVAAWKAQHGLKRLAMVGDGMSDVAARAPDAADVVIGYGGVVERAVVRATADHYSSAADLRDLLPLLVPASS